jgi:hypothetical protein
MKDLRIPMLTQNASAQDIINYLNWLGESDFCYHIDDCPTDIIFETEVSEEYVNLLKWNSDVMWNHQCEDINGFLWSNYNPSWNNVEEEVVQQVVEEIVEEIAEVVVEEIAKEVKMVHLSNDLGINKQVIKRNLKDLNDWMSPSEFTERGLDLPFEWINRRTQVYSVEEASILIEEYLTSHDECVMENPEDFSSIEVYTATAKENRLNKAIEILSKI